MGKKARQIFSCVLSVLTLLSLMTQPLMGLASEEPETEAYEVEYPPLDAVKDLLAEDEIVSAEDFILDAGSIFDIEHDFTDVKINPDKVKVTFYEAKNEDGQDFDVNQIGTYKAVYFVEPVSGNPKYHISRALVVREPETMPQTVSSDDDGSTEKDASDDAEAHLSEQAVAESLDSEMEAQSHHETEEPMVQMSEAEQEKTDIAETQKSETEPQVAPILPSEPEAEVVAGSAMESNTEQQTEPETEPIFSDIPEPETGDILIAESGNESEQESKTEAESEKESETESEKSGAYQVAVTKGRELGVVLNREDGNYNAGDIVQFSTDLPAGSLTAVGALKVAANAQGNTADLLYSEVTYHPESDTFSFEMPADDVSLEVAQDYAEGGIMPVASSGDDDLPWDEATEIEANTYYYYSDGKLHPFNSAMGSGGNDSYKYVRYKAGGKTYTVYAYCMQHSMSSPPSGTTYKNMVELDEGGDDKYLRKALFYGYGGPGWGKTFNGYNIQTIMTNAGCSSETRAMQHYLVDYLYDGESGIGGALSGTAKSMLADIKAALKKMPDPTAGELLPGLSVTANGKDTQTFTWKANEAFTLTIQLEKGVSLVNETTGKTDSGKVTVKGGDKFHLTATTDDVSSLSGAYTVTSNYPLDFHAMLLKLKESQDIGFGYYTDSSDLELKVDWKTQAGISITKRDHVTGTGLAGAVYGVYADPACSSLIVEMPATDSAGNSSVTFLKTQDVVYLKEITAPPGYTVDVSAHDITVEAGSTVQADVSDDEQLGQINVYKEGEVLTGAASSDAGVVFQYGKRRQPGAIFSVYAGADILTADGTLVYRAGDLVKDNLVTDSSGTASLSGLHLGSYVIKEVNAPANFICKEEEQPATLSYGGQTVDVVFAENTFTNDRQKAAVAVTKKDRETDNPLQGGIFGLYAGSDITNADGIVVVSKGALIEKAVSGADGSAVFHSDLPVGFSYDVKEVQAPEGYLRNTEDVYSFGFSYSNDREPVRSFTHTFTDVLVKAKITLHKVDAETKKPVPQGDASLEKAVYGLYAREDIVHPDGATGVLYKAGDKVATLTTDGGGDAFIDNLYLGSYFVKEISPPVGYLADGKEHDLICNYEGDLVAVVERSCTSEEQVKKQPFQIIKAANNGETDAGLLAGAGFRAYLVSGLGKKGDGSYDFNSTAPVVVGANGATEIFTDERGYACSIPLPYGTYIVRETTTPHNYTPVKDFYVRITEHMPDTPQVWRVLLDDEFEAKLKIIKTDDETKRPVLAADTEFKIYDVDNGAYIKQVTTYPTTVVHESFFTDGQGYLILPQSLKIGNYRIEEANAPFGYTLNRNYYNVAVDSDTAYQMDSVSEDIIITVPYENHPVKGELRIVKKGEVLDGYKKDFTYVTEPLAGAVFEVYAAEDIYTADFQTDGEGNRCLEYASGSLVCTVTTDGNGEAVVEDLPLGTYEAVEVTAPEGFVLDKAAQTVTFAYKDQDTPVISQTAEFENARQKVEIAAVKKDAETDSAVAGAVFSLYAKEDILAHGKVIVEADTLLAEAVTGQDGKAVFDVDVPFGTYYIREKEAPAGYVSSDAVLEVTASYQGQDVETVPVSAELKNEPTKVALKKSDITTGVELAGATLTVTDKDGNVVDTWTSVKGEEHVIERLTAGETYTLQEEMAPYGYLLAEKVKFTVEDTAEMQKAEMKDDVPTGLLIIDKKGEFLEDVLILDNVGGWISHLFSYFSGELKDVTFDVYALEDIKAADGESADYYKKDELVETITTNDRGYAELSDLPLGKYYVKEKETAEGYVLDDEAREIDLTYRDQDTPVVTYSSDWQNNRQKVSVSVLKKEKGTDRVLEGAVFALCAKEDITNAAGDVILEADTVIEEKATNREGKLTFEADLPIGFSYYVKETVPAPGFATCKDVQEFTFQYEGPEQETVPYEYTFEDEPTVVKFTKTSLLGGEEIEGAKLQVTDENGTVVDEWVSEKEPHFINELTVGAKYTMTELLPAPGYVTAESIPFIVGDTAETQVIEMKDDITNVVISKQDIAGKELPGAKLTVLDKDGKEVESWVSGDEPHYIEMLPIGEYILREETAPEGYLVAEEVPFEVLDTWDVQTVIMQDDYTKVEISKQDIAGEELPGAELTVLDKDGKEVESWVSGEEPHYIEMLPAGVYILREETAPDGYLVAEDIQFEIQPTGEVQKVVMVDKPVETEPVPEGTVGTPKTGDSRHTAFWILISIFAVCGITASTVLLMKKRRE